MAAATNDTLELFRRINGGDAQALADLFARYQERLRRMLRLRLDRRLQGRLDASEVLRQTAADVARRACEYLARPPASTYLWLRAVTGERLQALHEAHLGTYLGEAGQELSIYRGSMPEANSVSLAAQLLGRMVSLGEAADRADKQIRLQEALNGMDAADREILALRHFEELANDEAALVLQVSAAEAMNRYLRALKNLKTTLSRMPGFFHSKDEG
jgi:RNA polymerase sigma-70 factor (ECF subfamily)